jgi:hypothetical protein
MDSASAAISASSGVTNVPDAAEPLHRRRQAVSALLLKRPSLLLPVASQLREGQPLFESAIRGSSMAPAIPSYARLQVQLLAGRHCEPGDVVYYLAGGGYVVHRVVWRARRGHRAEYLVTCGDNRLTPDPPVPSSRVLGTVVAVQGPAGWEGPRPLVLRGALPAVRRAIRAITRGALVAALWLSPAAADRLADALLQAEIAGRRAIWRWRARPRLAPRAR